MTGGQRYLWHFVVGFENLGAVRGRRCLRCAAVFTMSPSNDAKFAALGTGQACGPFLNRQHQDQADPSVEKPQGRPVKLLSARERMASSEEETSERAGRRGEYDHRDVAGHQTFWRHFEPCSSRYIEPAVFQISKKQRF